MMKFSLRHVEQEGLKNAEEAYRQALAAVGGDFESRTTIEQQFWELRWRLMNKADQIVSLLRQAGKHEETQPYQDVWDKCFDSLYETIERSENEEDKGWFSSLAGECASFAERGMIDKAVAVAKLSQEPGQYNAAENLTNVARIVARNNGFDQAIPIIDEAIEAAKKLSSWSEGEIVSAVRLYMEVGRTKRAEEILASLSLNGRLSVLLMTLDVLLARKKDQERYPEILKQCEALAAEIEDKDDRPQAFISIAYRYVGCGMFEEGEQLVELKSQNAVPREIDLFRWTLADHLMQEERREDAEKQLDKIVELDKKAYLSIEILWHERDTPDKENFRRLIAKAESFVRAMKPEGDRIDNLFRLAAYKIKVGDETEGRKMMEELLASSPDKNRDYVIGCVAHGFARAALYDDAVAMIETMESPAGKAGAYTSLATVYLEQEDRETLDKRYGWRYLLDEENPQKAND